MKDEAHVYAIASRVGSSSGNQCRLPLTIIQPKNSELREMIDPFCEGENFLPIYKVASRLGMATNTVRRWRKKCGLSTTRLGDREYITREDWAAFVLLSNSGEQTGVPRVRTEAQRERDQIAAVALCEAMGI